MRLAASFALVVALVGPAWSQDRDATLADIRQQITILTVELQRLGRELSTTGTAPGDGTGAGIDAQARIDGIEGELRRLTAKIEELEFRIDRIVRDGTNRLADLDFRLTELEGGDLGQAGNVPPLGGDAAALATAAAPQPDQTVQLAVAEEVDFEAALGLVGQGDPQATLVAFERFLETYPRSPLAAEAQLYRGEALATLLRPQEAGRAYLESYTLAETTNPGLAAEALHQLGATLAVLGQTREACLTLGQVGARFPQTAAAPEAAQVLSGLTCP